MTSVVFSLHDQATELRYPGSLRAKVALLFGVLPPSGPANHYIRVREDEPGRYSIAGDTRHFLDRGLTEGELLDALLDEVVYSLIYRLDSAVAMHAASIGWGGKSILIPGATGAGKTSLAGWLVAKDFEFLSDELAVLVEDGRFSVTFPRPLLAKSETEELLALMARTGRHRTVRTASNTVICLDPPSPGLQRRAPGLILFPQFVAGAELQISAVSPAMSGLRLMASNLNVRNLPDHGLATLARLGRVVPALDVTYGAYEQLDGVLDELVKFVVERAPDVTGLLKLTRALCPLSPPAPGVPVRRPPAAPAASAIPEATPRRQAKRMTIGMAAYDDYDGVYFTLQGLRLYHPEILDDTELLLIDNHPDGPQADALKKFESWIPNYRYVPQKERSGTAVRDFVFQEASGEIVLCIDCHVLVAPGALRRLIDYFDANPGTRDLLQGPLLFDNLTSVATHFVPKWRAGMYGIWDTGAEGAEIDGPPFEIPMQGLGLFACRRDAWPGFNPAFRGFGGEEGYIHEKFRRRGGRTLCLPFLRWVHRFHRPAGAPYVNRWEDRIRNYLIGFRELGWDTGPIVEHFADRLGDETAARIINSIERELATLGGEQGASVAPGSAEGPRAGEDRIAPFASLWDEESLARQRRLIGLLAAVAEKQDIALYLYWGSLLGHVREGRILPWDDDVDFALFEPARVAELRTACLAAGLKTHEIRLNGETWIKVYDPGYPVSPHPRYPWTWPCVDVFIYALQPAPAGIACPISPYPRELIVPGRTVVFEGARCWEPEQPLAVLDRQYADWRTREISAYYCHRTETAIRGSTARAIETDTAGRKIGPVAAAPAACSAAAENPLNRDAFMPLLRRWIELCGEHRVRYSIFWGTLLGQWRDRRIIPYDNDLDVVIGKSGLDTLYALPGRVPGCVFNDALGDQPAWRDHEVRLVVRRDLSAGGPRYDHRGRKVASQVDSCAFNGPLARLVIKLPPDNGGRAYWHLDVDLFTDLSRFNPYPAAHDVEELPELEERPLEGLAVSCIKDAVPYLTAFYGPDYMTPDHIESGGRWIRPPS